MLVIFRAMKLDFTRMIPETLFAELAAMHAVRDPEEEWFGIVIIHEEEPECPGHIVYVCPPGSSIEDAEAELLRGQAEHAEEVMLGQAYARPDVLYVDPQGNLRQFSDLR